MLFLTSNENKLREAKEILGDRFIIERLEIDLDEIQSIKAEEVIAHKINQAKKILADKEFFVEDTCLYLGRDKDIGPLIKFFPKSRIVKAYLGEEVEAVCTVGLSNGEIFQGRVKGKIVEPRGNSNFGWDPIFQPDGYNQTFAEMTKEEKHAISHRKQAFEKLLKYLLERENSK